MKNEIKIILSSAVISVIFLFSVPFQPITASAGVASSTSDLMPLAATSTPPILTLAETEDKIRQYFADDPIMISIAKCESGFRHFNNDGTVLVGHGLYVGVFQIDPNIHADFAKSLGMDIYTLEGNLAYAKHLKGRSGVNPWPACSKKAVSLTLTLKLGASDSQVKTVQQILNSAGFALAKDGPGSSGNETAYFGSLTKNAVKKFQCAKNIVCNGTESTTGFGLVGPRTRMMLVQEALNK